jgi:hypothetical protein
MAEPELDLFYGCTNCGKVILIEEVPKRQLIAPLGLEVDCPSCGWYVGLLIFETAELLEAALERELPGGRSGRPHLRWYVARNPPPVR